MCRFLFFIFICIAIGNASIKMVRVGIPLPSLTQPLFCACPKSRPGFQTLYVVIHSGSFVCDCLCVSCRDDNK